jgi:hypothetical protein
MHRTKVRTMERANVHPGAQGLAYGVGRVLGLAERHKAVITVRRGPRRRSYVELSSS